MTIYERDGEVGVAKMAKLISDELGFRVDQDCVMKAARSGKITSRSGPPHRRRYFLAEVVLAEIRGGGWRPHRSGRPAQLRVCANPRCTKGPDGRRREKEVPQSQLDKLKPGHGWTCSRECTNAVMKGRGRNRGEPWERRRCGCVTDGEPCPNFIVVTAYQNRKGSGPKRCDRCKAAGRRTEAHLASARASLEANRQAPAAREHMATHAAKLGQQNRRSPDRMARLIAARVRAHGTAYTEEMDRAIRGRALSRGQREGRASVRATRRAERFRELWLSGMPVPRIAEQMAAEFPGKPSITEPYLRKMRQRLELPQRKPGPQPASS